MADGVRSHDPLNGPVNTQVAVLASALRRRAPELAGQLAGRIIKQIDFYAEGGPVPREDLYESCRDNIEFMFGHLGDLGPRDLSAPRRTGRRRAEQGAPIAAVLSSFRIGARRSRPGNGCTATQHGAPPPASHRASDRPFAARPQGVRGATCRFGGAAQATRAGRRLRLKRSDQVKALCPVMSRPTRSVWICAVPS